MSSRSSIFSFETLQERPSLSMMFFAIGMSTLLCFLGTSFLFNRANSLYLLEANPGIFSLINLKNNNSALLPKILIAGDSRNGNGIIPKLIDDKLGISSAKITLAASTVWEPLKFLNLYSEQTRDIRILVFDIDPIQFYEQSNFLQGGNTFVVFREKEDPYPGYKDASRFKKTNHLLPTRFTLHQILELFLAAKKVRADSTSWREIPSNQKKSFHIGNECSSDNLKIAINKRNAAQFNDRLLPALDQLLNECERRNILVVFNIVPTYEGRYFMYDSIAVPVEYCDSTLDRKYREVYNELVKRPNVVFIGFKRFSDIGVEKDEESLFRDFHHLLPEGAVIYTNWLATEMFKNPKVRLALGMSPADESEDKTKSQKLQKQETSR